MLDVCGKFRQKFAPQGLRITRDGKLRVGIVHHRQMAHTGGCGTTTDCVTLFDDRDRHARAPKFPRTCRPDNSRPYNNRIRQCIIVTGGSS